MKHFLQGFALGLSAICITAFAAVTINSVATNTGGGGSVLPESIADYRGLAGYGSTNTMVPYYTTENELVGTDFTAANSATNGLSLTINTDGVYAFTYCHLEDSGNGYFGLSKDADGTVAFLSLADANQIIGMNPFGPDFVSCLAWTGWLEAGDVIRPHTHGEGVPGSAARGTFRATRVY